MSPKTDELIDLTQKLLVACDQSYAGKQLIPGESQLFRLDEAPLFGEFQPPYEAYFPQYRVAFAEEDPTTGFKVVIYRNDEPREIIVAMAGTDGADHQDWWSSVTHYGWNQWSRNRVLVLQAIDTLVSGLGGPNGETPKIYFTGQSLGGALAQYAAYEFAETHGQYARSNLSLITFNGLGAVAGLREEIRRRGLPEQLGYPGFVDKEFVSSRVDGFAHIAHYGSLNDLVWRAGAGHLGGHVYSFEGLNFASVNPQTGKPFLLDTIAAHRIESGFYYPLTEFNSAAVSAFEKSISAGPISKADVESRYLKLDKVQKLASVLGNVFRQTDANSAGAMVNLLFGGLGSLALGDSAQVNHLVSEYVETRDRAGKYVGREDEYQAAKNTDWALRLRIGAVAMGVPLGASPFGLVIKLVGAIALAPLYKLIEGISNDDLAFLQTFRVQRQGQSLPESTFQEALERSSLIGVSLDVPNVPEAESKLHTVAELTRGDVEGFANAMVSGGASWYSETDKYLRARANTLGLQDKIQDARNEFWAFSRQSAESNPTLLASIANQQVVSMADFANAVANLNAELIAPKNTSTQISGLDTYARKRSVVDSVITGLDAALGLFAGTAHAAETRAAAEKAIADVKAAAQTVVIRPGTSRNPFDNTSDPNGSVPTGTLKEGQVLTYTAYLPYEAGSGGQRISLKLAGTSAAKLRVLDRADEITPGGDGSFVLTVTEGSREVSFGLWAKEDVDANDTLTLSATLTDGSGTATHQTHTEVVLRVTAVNEPDPGAVQTVDGTPLADVVTTAGVIGAPIPDLDPQRTSILNGTAGGDLITGGPRADTFSGGDGPDWIYSHGVYDANFEPLADAAAETLMGGVGNDLLQAVRSAARLDGGDGDDVLDASRVSALGFNLINQAAWLDLGERFSVRPGAVSVDESGRQVLEYDIDFGSEDFSGISRWGGGSSTTFSYRAAEKTYILQSSGDPTVVTINRSDIPHSSTASVSLYGGEGNDTAIGNNGNDYLSGDAGNDRLAGNGGEDALYGGAGDDQIAGGAGADLAHGGDGADVIFGEDGSDAIYGGAGNDVLQGDSVALDGAVSGDDIIDGGDGDDTLFGQGGADTLRGGGGNDVLDGDSGAAPLAFHGSDTLDGGAGDDELNGRGGDDRLDGGDGRDTLLGGAGKDFLDGGAGDDLIAGNEGDDTIFGGAGADNLQGQQGNDSLAGGEGADVLFGQDGDDQLFGGGGSDQLTAGDGNDSLSGDEGNDTLFAEAGNDAVRAGAGDDLVQGGAGDDQLFGDGGADTLHGEAGSDLLSGGPGNDFLLGGADADRYLIELGGGADVVQDRQGLSTIVFGSGIAVTDLVLLSGTDQDGSSYLVIEISSSDTVAIEGALTGDNERYQFADGTALNREQLMERARRRGFQRVGTSGTDHVDGDIGDDEVEGGGGDDLLRGGIGNDVYVFSEGDGVDTLEDARGSDTVRFGEDIDDASLTAAASFDPFSRANRLTVGYGMQGDRIEILEGVLDGIERFEFADGTVLSRAEVLNRALTPLTITGTEQDDLLAGSGSFDTLYSLGGSDYLAALDGSDQLYGGEGNDTLDGGAGADRLFGEGGDDTYVFAPGAGADLVSDFSGSNRLRFEGVSYDAVTLLMASDASGKSYLVLNSGTDSLLVADGLIGGFDTVTFSGSSGEVTVSRRALLGDKLGEPLNFTALDNQGIDLSGGSFDDAIAGGNLADLIEGADGSDSLAGRRGNDVLRGGAGNDFLNGNEGLDTLEGGAGDDTYAIGATMGFDLITDADGMSTLWLLPGNPDSSFVAQASGNDLLLTLRNSSEGARVSGYYVDPSRWQVRKTDGSIQDLPSWLASLPPTPPAETVANWEEIYRARVAATLAADWTSQGYELRADGLYHLDTTFETQFFRSESKETRSIREVTRISDSEAIFPRAEGVETTGSHTTITEVIPYPRHDLGGASFYPQGQSTSPLYVDSSSGHNGVSMPAGSTIVTVNGPNARNPHTGEIEPSIAGRWIYPPGASGSAPQPVIQTTTRFSHFLSTDRKFILEKIEGGDSANQIAGSSYTIIDAGGGDDNLSMAGWGGITGSGMFLYGNAGDDNIEMLGAWGSDILIGGAGNDRLDGGGGSDEYVFFPGDGADEVWDSGGINDFAWPDPGLLPDSGTDTLVLPAGVTAAELSLTWDTALSENNYVELDRRRVFGENTSGTAQSVYSFLTLSWGGNQSVRVRMAHAEDYLGQGIEQVRFADGATLTRAQLLALAPPQETDPHQQDNVINASGVIWGAGGNDIIEGDGLLIGGEGSDTLRGGGYLFGGLGWDILEGGAGDDVLGGAQGIEFFGGGNSYRGGAGNDTLYLSIDSDTIHYDFGDGIDTLRDLFSDGWSASYELLRNYSDIYYGNPAYFAYAGIDPFATEYRAADTIVFGPGVTPDMLSLGLGSLFIRVGNDGHGIRVAGFDANDPYRPGPVGELRFADGTTWSYRQLIDRGFDHGGTEFDDSFSGTAATDRFAGGAGSDFYYFGYSAGRDTIREFASPADSDTLWVAGSWNEVHVSREDNDLVVHRRGTDDRVALLDWYRAPAARIELVSFDDGTSWDAATLESRAGVLINAAPQLSSPLPDQVLEQGEPIGLALQGVFTDSDPGDSLTLAATLADGSPLPGWLALDSVQARLEGTPGAQDAGTFQIRILARDASGATTLDDFSLAVLDANFAPVLLEAVADVQAWENAEIVVALPAALFLDGDADDRFVLAAQQEDGSALPHWLAFDAAALTLSGTPGNQDVGETRVRLVAVDRAGAAASASFTIDVHNVNDAPLAGPSLLDQSAQAGSGFEYSIPVNAFVDIDPGDTLALQARLGDGSPLPSWLSFDPESGTFSGAPQAMDIGISRVSVTATDAAGESAISDFSLIVRAAAGTTATGGVDDDFLYGNTGDETLKAKGGSDYLYGDAGNDLLRGGLGSDVLQGGDGGDTLRGGIGQNILEGGAGDDVLYGGQGSGFLAGGAGNDVLRVGQGNDLIAFNLGDGVDTVYGGRDGGNTLSFGGGLDYDDLSFSKDGKDLVLNAGAEDRVVLKNWYNGNKSVLNLQLIDAATAEFDADSTDPLYKKSQTFDFLGLVSSFDAARAASPGLTSWALTNALLQWHLWHSDDAAIGGDLAYWYGKNGSLSGISIQAAQEVVGASGFGSDAQTLRPFTGLQEGFAKLT